MKYLASIVTGVRILMAALILLCNPFSMEFYIFYSIGGFTDMIDGTIARKTNSAGYKGAVLDSVADLCFMAAVVGKVFQNIIDEISLPFLLIIAGIICLKLFTMISGMIRFKCFVSLHTRLNKITGAALFFGLYLYEMADFSYVIAFLCGLASVAAIEECICLFRMKSYDPDVDHLTH